MTTAVVEALRKLLEASRAAGRRGVPDSDVADDLEGRSAPPSPPPPR